MDSELDAARKRIAEIDRILGDNQEIARAIKKIQDLIIVADEKADVLKKAESQVAVQNQKIEQNQKKLYGGAVTNPKELEDLQLEANSLHNYLQVLEDRQLEAMIASDQARSEQDLAQNSLDEIRNRLEAEHTDLLAEKKQLEAKMSAVSQKKEIYLGSSDLPDLPLYSSLRESSGGIAVTLMISSSCASCGSSIPSAIAQEAHFPAKLAQCPTCKRILHPG